MTSSWTVCIPSYLRPTICAKKTLKTLLSGGVSEDKIIVFVASTDEEIAYKAAGITVKIVVGVPGLVAQRQFIQQQFPIGHLIVFMDDDLTQIKRLNDLKLAKVTDIPALFDEAFTEMNRVGANIWGVYPVASALYMSHTITTTPCYICGGLYGICNTIGPTIRYGDNQEDKERTLRYWKRDGVLCRLNYITFLTRNYATGGLDSPTRKIETESATKQLVDEFPCLISQTYKAKHGIWDIKFKRLLTVPKRVSDTNIEELPVGEGYTEAKAKLLTELRKIRIPTLGPPTKPNRLAAHRSRADQIGSIGRSATFGFGNTRYRGINEFSFNKKHPEVLRALIELGNLIVPADWEYTTITLNHGVQARKHLDSRNVGKSVIIGFGDYDGGELRVWDANDENPRDINLKDRPHMFNGSLLPHETQPFTGNRYTIIYYKQQWKGCCKGMPEMKGNTKSVPLIEHGEIGSTDADEELSTELSL